MHRRMIADVDDILAEVGDPEYVRVEGWPTVPAPGDTEYPVPPPFAVPGNPGFTDAIEFAKGADVYDEILQWEAHFTDPVALRGMTLGRLGASIEYSIHNRLHLRWAAPSAAYRPDGDPFDVDSGWDDADYDWLADTYSAHVNPIFWKLHGWVDARIDGWMDTNGLTGPVPWSFDPPWIGPADHEGGHRHTVAGPGLRTHPDVDEALVLDAELGALESTIEDLRRACAREPAPLFTVIA